MDDKTSSSSMEVIEGTTPQYLFRPWPIGSKDNQKDIGLTYLLPLYQFLRNECSLGVHYVLMSGFKEAEYVKHYLQSRSLSHMSHNTGITFYQFLQEIEHLGKCKVNQKGKGSQKQEASCSQSSLPKTFTQIHNLDNHCDILEQVMIDDLLNENYKQCNVLRNLDVSFVLNIIANEYLKCQVSTEVLKAVNQIKDTRNRLVHPKLKFSQEDFDESFSELLQATEVLYGHTGKSFDTESVKSVYQDMIFKHEEEPAIFEKLRSEIHSCLSVLSTYVPPTILDTSMKYEYIIEDFSKYVFNCKNPPILLCGSAGAGKSTILRNLAYWSKINEQYSLVLYLDDRNRRFNCKKAPGVIKNCEDFWEQIYKCIKCLARDTIKEHGFDAVKAIIEKHANNILFLVDWHIHSIVPFFKEMEKGTWVVSHQEIVMRSNDWRVLRIKSFSPYQVKQLLSKYSDQVDLSYLYDDCEFKHILTSPNMVRVFLELKSTVNFNTDYELLEEYLKIKEKSVNCVNFKTELLELGKVAFCSLRNGRKYGYKLEKLCNIDEEVRDMFLFHSEDREYLFVHASVEEMVAAYYLVHDPKKACQDWLSDVQQFKSVFRFACAMWCKENRLDDRVLHYMEEYLAELYGVNALRKTNKNAELESMEVEGRSKRKNKKQNSIDFDGSFRNPFSDWEYLCALDDVCQGHPDILILLGKFLSICPFWLLTTNEIDDRMLKRMEVIIKKVRLNTSPVTIKLNSTRDVTGMIRIWNKLKNIKTLHKYAYVKISILCESGFPYIERENLTNLCSSLATAHCPVYITSYEGPFLCTEVPEFYKGMSCHKLVSVDVTVYDIVSLCEIMDCEDLVYLKDISVTVQLRKTEQNLGEGKKFKIPMNLSVRLRIKYFEGIQKLFQMAQNPENLKTLTVYEVSVCEKFSINLSAFTNLENLTVICEPVGINNVGHISQNDEYLKSSADYESMEVDRNEYSLPEVKTEVPRFNWMFQITQKLQLPVNLERLLLRNMDFCNNSNSYLIKILENYRLTKLVILDSYLSLQGVRDVLRSHSGLDSEIEFVTKKFKSKNLETDEIVQQNFCKRLRLSAEERERMRMEKPVGKELVITSNIDKCQVCCIFPCECLDGKTGNKDSLGDMSKINNKDTLDDMIHLLEDVYKYDIISFSYTSRVVTVRKDVCGDMMVSFIISNFTDTAVCDTFNSGSGMNRLFITLSLAQAIQFDKTHLTFEGVKRIIDALKQSKTLHSVNNIVEPFTLQISSEYHPNDEKVLQIFLETLKKEDIFTVFYFHCSCENKCFKIKKTHNGKIIVNGRVVDSI